MSGVKWIFEILDKVSAPAKAITTSLDKVTAASDKAKQSFTATEKAMGRSRDAMGRFTKGFTDIEKATGRGRDALGRFVAGAKKTEDSLLPFGMGNLFSGLSEVSSSLQSIAKWGALAGAAVGGMLTAFGVSVVKAQAFKETTLTSLKLILKDGNAAREVYDDAISIAQKTPFDTRDVLSGMKKLLAIGFDRKDARFAFQALGDVASMSESPGQSLDMMTLAMGQIKAAGKLQMQDLRQITNWSASAGVGLSQVYDTLGGMLRVKSAEIPKMMERGLISGEQGIYAILKTFQDRVSGGVAGSVSVAQSATLSGLLSNLSSKPFEMLQGLQVSEGMKAFRDFLTALNDAMDPTTSAGKQTLEVLSGIANELFSGFKDLSDPKKLQSLLTDIGNGAKLAWTVIRELGSGIKVIFDAAWPSVHRILEKLTSEDGKQAIGRFAAFAEAAFMNVGQAISNATTLVEMLFGAFNNVKTKMTELMHGTGGTLVEGLIAGVTGGLPGLATFMATDFSGAVVDGVKSPQGLDIHSPSRKFMELGEYSRMGFEQGLAGTDVAGAIQPRAPSGGGRGGFTIHFGEGAISIDARGGDGAEIARQLSEILPGELAAAFEAMAIEGGVA